MTGENDLNEKSPAGNFLQKKFHAGLIPDKGIVFVKLSSMCCVVLCCVVLCCVVLCCVQGLYRENFICQAVFRVFRRKTR